MATSTCTSPTATWCPWEKSVEDGGRWRWVRTDSPQSRGDVISLPGVTVRYVSRLFHDGLYLPGWYHPATDTPFRVVSPDDNQVQKCLPYSGEFLVFNKTSDYRWESFTAGDSVSDSAIAIAQLHDGTPLYVVHNTFRGPPSYDLTGYYNPITK